MLQSIVSTVTGSTTSNAEDGPTVQVTESAAQMIRCDAPGIDGQLTTSLTCDMSALEDNSSKSKVALILAVDASGSMGRAFRSQVVPALLYIAERAFESEVTFRVVYYDNRAEVIRFTKDNYRAVLGALNTRGSTSFSAAFNACSTAIAELDSIDSYTNVVVGFLTDGCNNCGSYDSALSALKAHLRKLHDMHSVVSTCHSIAFTASHDFNFLDKLRRELGFMEGGFQYAEPSDGPNALQEKLQCVFDVVASKRLPATVTVRAPDGFQFVQYGDDEDKLSDTFTYESGLVNDEPTVIDTIVRSIGDQSQSSQHSFSMTDDNDDNNNSDIEIEVTLTVNDNTQTFQCPCSVTVVPKLKSGSIRARQFIARLEALEQCISAGAAANTNNPTWSKKLDALVKEMGELQSSADLFSLCKTKKQRRDMLEIIADFSKKANVLASMLGSIATGRLTNAQKARFAELAHGAQFKRARRQRDLDQRSARNVEKLQEAEKQLQEVELDREALQAISEEHAGEFRCVLTQETWVDLLMEDQSDDRDVIGFGIACQRPETCIDDPTQLRIRDVSVTTVGRGAFEDATIYKLATDDRFKRADGFNLGGELAVAMRGLGREPINGWAPLYINKEHWKMQLPQIPAALGYLVTLDPLGYNSNQIDVLFLLLGTMAMALREPGERELKLLMQFQRTCAAVLTDMKWFKRAQNSVASFVASPPARLKDKTTNLVVLIGYALALPSEALDTVLPDDASRRAFWFAVLGESMRRAADGMYRNAADDANRLVKILVDGDQGCDALDADALAAHAALDSQRGMSFGAPEGARDNNNNQSDVPRGNGGGKGAVVSSQANSGQKKQATLVAPAAASKQQQSKGKRRRHEVPEGLVVDAELERSVEAEAATLLGQSMSSSAMDEDAKGVDKWTPLRVDMQMLNALLRFEQALRTRAHPTVAGVLSLCTYVEAWRGLCSANGGSKALFEQMDAAYGLAPNEWCDQIKATFTVRSKLGNSVAALFALLDQLAAGDAEAEVTTSSEIHRQARALVARAVSLRVNKRAREACEESKDGDATNLVGSDVLLQNLHTQLAAEEKAESQRASRSMQLHHCIASCLRTSNMRVFVGWLISENGFAGRRNTEHFKALFSHFLADDVSGIPLFAEKLRILLDGRYTASEGGTAINLLDDGRAWLPRAAVVNRLARLHADSLDTAFFTQLRERCEEK